MPLIIVLILTVFTTTTSIAADLDSSNVSGFDFSYMDIEKKCTVQREGHDSLSVECDDSALKSVARSCGGFIPRGLESAQLNCGGALWVLNERCKIEMRGADYGELNCKL